MPVYPARAVAGQPEIHTSCHQNIAAGVSDLGTFAMHVCAGGVSIDRAITRVDTEVRPVHAVLAPISIIELRIACKVDVGCIQYVAVHATRHLTCP